MSDVEKLPKGTLTAKYNEAQNRWTLSGATLEQDIFGSNVIKGPGFNLNILGQPVDGDELTTTPLSGGTLLECSLCLEELKTFSDF